MPEIDPGSFSTAECVVTMTSGLTPFLRYSAQEHKLKWSLSSASGSLEGREDLVVTIRVKATDWLGEEYATEYSLSVYVTNLTGAEAFQMPLPPIFSEQLQELVIEPGTPQDYLLPGILELGTPLDSISVEFDLILAPYFTFFEDK